MTWWDENKFGLQIRWNITGSTQFEIEVIDWAHFVNKRERFEGKTKGIWSGGKDQSYFFTATRRGNRMIFDYPPHPSNTVEDGFTYSYGKTTIEFSKDLQWIISIKWDPTSKKEKQKILSGQQYFWRTPLASKSTEEFDFESFDNRKKVNYEVAIRPEQAAFKKDLLEIYEKCCITGCEIKEALDAAHIRPYNGPPSCNLSNGILLRADLHCLFDSKKFGIDPETCQVVLGKQLAKSEIYKALEGKKLHPPKESRFSPWKGALEYKWMQFIEANKELSEKLF